MDGSALATLEKDEFGEIRALFFCNSAHSTLKYDEVLEKTIPTHGKISSHLAFLAFSTLPLRELHFSHLSHHISAQEKTELKNINSS